MPSTGFYLFLQQMTTRTIFRISVSMPSTGFYLFLQNSVYMSLKTMNVSMPSTGCYLFLQQTTNHRYHILQKCVNALNGLLLISSNLQSNYRFLKAVSMPSTGFYLFLPKSRCSSLSWFMCQCPQRASTYFFSTLPEPLILLSSGEVF